METNNERDGGEVQCQRRVDTTMCTENFGRCGKKKDKS